MQESTLLKGKAREGAEYLAPGERLVVMVERGLGQMQRNFSVKSVSDTDLTPIEFAGDLMSDFNARRGKVAGMDMRESIQMIRAPVPMAEMLTYDNELTSTTQGRGSFHMDFDHYDFVPALQAERIIAAAKMHLRVDEDE